MPGDEDCERGCNRGLHDEGDRLTFAPLRLLQIYGIDLTTATVEARNDYRGYRVARGRLSVMEMMCQLPGYHTVVARKMRVYRFSRWQVGQVTGTPFLSWHSLQAAIFGNDDSFLPPSGRTWQPPHGTPAPACGAWENRTSA